MKSCHRCATPWPATVQVGFNNTCEGCGFSIHCCANCSSYQPRAQRRCSEPGAPDLRDPTQANRCEYFQFRIQAAAGPDADLAIEDVRRQLLADDDGAAAEPKTSWDQLFSD